MGELTIHGSEKLTFIGGVKRSCLLSTSVKHLFNHRGDEKRQPFAPVKARGLVDKHATEHRHLVVVLKTQMCDQVFAAQVAQSVFELH